MNTQQEQKLFRQQVVDEFSTKLNGEVILNSNFSRKFIIGLIIWLLIGLTINNFFEIKISQTIHGNFLYDNQGGLVAKFFMNPHQADNIYPGQRLSAEIRNFSSEEAVLVPIEVAIIDRRLKVAAADDVLIEITAGVTNSNVLIKGREYKIDEGIPFSIDFNEKNMSLTEWILVQLFGDRK